MNIETRYNVGDKIWHGRHNNLTGEISTDEYTILRIVVYTVEDGISIGYVCRMDASIGAEVYVTHLFIEDDVFDNSTEAEAAYVLLHHQYFNQT